MNLGMTRFAKGIFSLIGVGEVVLLPLDVLKIKRQTNPEAFRGRGVFKIIADEGLGLYRGTGWTMARNFPGSFAVGCIPHSQAAHFAKRTSSYSAARQQRSSICLSLKTTTRQHGHRTLWPPLPAQAPPSLYQHHWMLSRPGYRTAISKSRKAAFA